MPSASPLPRLLFGNDLADEVVCAQAYGDRMAKVLTTLNAFEAKCASGQFRARSCSVDLNGLVLTANACTPVHVEVSDSSVVNLMVPFSGSNVSTYEKRSYNWQAGQAAMFFPAVGRGGYSSTRSVLTLKLDPARLSETVRCMQGIDQPPELRLDAPQLLSLQHDGTSLLMPLQHIGAMIDAWATRPNLLSALNLDDVLYRWMGLLFTANADLSASPAKTANSAPQPLDRVCDYALSRLDAGITLTELEREAGMSQRNLQYAFAKRFGLTPMAWLREQRLIKARCRLLRPAPYDTVTHIALSFGFGKPATFARYYREAFGELPSTTLRRGKSTVLPFETSRCTLSSGDYAPTL